MDRPVVRQTGFAQDLLRTEIERACRDLCCCVEAGRQAGALLAQMVDAVMSETSEVQRKLLQSTREHAELGFTFAEQIIDADCLEEVLYIQSEFARNAVNAYARQVRDLLCLLILFAPRDRALEH